MWCAYVVVVCVVVACMRACVAVRLCVGVHVFVQARARVCVYHVLGL